jgi:hypothetical protein
MVSKIEDPSLPETEGGEIEKKFGFQPEKDILDPIADIIEERILSWSRKIKGITIKGELKYPIYHSMVSRKDGNGNYYYLINIEITNVGLMVFSVCQDGSLYKYPPFMNFNRNCKAEDFPGIDNDWVNKFYKENNLKEVFNFTELAENYRELNLHQKWHNKKYGRSSK